MSRKEPNKYSKPDLASDPIGRTSVRRPLNQTRQPIVGKRRKTPSHSGFWSTMNRSNRTGLLILGGLILTFFALVLILISRYPNEPELPQDENQVAVVPHEFKERLSFQGNDALNYHSFGDRIVKVTRDEITLSDLEGNQIYSETVQLNQPVVVRSDLYFLVADRQSQAVLILDQQGKKLSLQLEGSFAGAVFGGTSYLCLIEENVNKPGFVHLLSLETGDKLLTIQFADSGYPVAADFSKNLDFLDVLLINTKSQAIQPIIKRYDLSSGQQIGQKIPVDHPFLYAKIFHDEQNNIVLTSSSNFLVMNLDQEDEVLADHSFGQIIQVVQGDALTILASDQAGGEVQINDWSMGDLIRHIGATGQGIQAVASRGRLVAFSNQNQIFLYDQKARQILLRQKLDSDIVRIGFSADELVLITLKGVRTIAVQ